MASAVRAERPATFGDALRVREFRAIFFAQLLSELGDQLARVALSVLVYRASNSPLLTALTYALTYLPAALGGPLLGPIADRASRRQVMVRCDLVRGAIVSLMALPRVPLGVLLVLLAFVTLLQGPFDASRASLLPDTLPGDLYVAGQSLGRLLNQSSQVVGFAFGGLLLTIMSPRNALLIDAVTFGFSGLVLFIGVRAHYERRTSIARQPFIADIVDGIHIVFSSRLLSGLVALAWVGTAFVMIPEALAAPYARELGRGATAVGLILAASPVGTVLGVTAISQLVSPRKRIKLVRPLAVLSCVPLIVGLFHPPLAALLICLFVSGAAMSFHIPANQAFMLALAPEARGRGFGLASGGLALSQGLGLLLGGLVAEWLSPAVTVGMAGLVGTAIMPVIATYAGYRGEFEPPAEVRETQLNHSVG